MELKNIMGIVEYDGSKYFGWQRQRNLPTIQGEIERALSIILRKDIKIKGASRTDRGVHSKGQVFNFFLNGPLDLAELKRRLNSLLPESIAIKSLKYVSPEFHARKSAKKKLYRYKVVLVKSPLQRKFSWHINIREKPKKKVLESLNELAGLIIGKHDFRGFSKCTAERERTTCTIYEAKWINAPQGFVFHICGDYFIRGMVRALVGAMISVATGKMTKEEFITTLNEAKRTKNYKVAPPEGLLLVKIFY